jgi:hypothetical protein
MLGFEDKHGSNSMTLPSRGNENLTEDEWYRMTALKNVINERPQAVVPEKMEEFTEYLVRSLRERGG